jgi:hypothetical protein
VSARSPCDRQDRQHTAIYGSPGRLSQIKDGRSPAEQPSEKPPQVGCSSQ